MSATFEEAIQPLLDAHAALDADVKEKEEELSALRDKRDRLARAVRALDPERLPGGKKNGRVRERDRARFSQKSVDYVRGFVQNYSMALGEFGTTKLLEHPAYEGVGSTTLSHVLRQLHEEGTLRLVRTGKGLSRYYEVIK